MIDIIERNMKYVVIPIQYYTYRTYAVRFVVEINRTDSEGDRNPFITRLL